MYATKIVRTSRCGARLHGSKSNGHRKVIFVFFTYNKLMTSRVHPQQHKQLTNTTTMVMEPLAPPVALIQWFHAA
jgi:hypothetical protein